MSGENFEPEGSSASERKTSGPPTKIAVLISGRGSNMVAIARACAEGVVPGEIVFVGSDRADAPGLEAARSMGLDALVFSYAGGREAAEDEIASAVLARGAEYVVLAGFMRVLTPGFVRRFAGRIVNIHPSLLPDFPGAHAIRDALVAGARRTGVTVHLVDELVDHGPILAQEALGVIPGDDEDSLAARIHEIEHRIYPAVLRRIFAGGTGV